MGDNDTSLWSVVIEAEQSEAKETIKSFLSKCKYLL